MQTLIIYNFIVDNMDTDVMLSFWGVTCIVCSLQEESSYQLYAAQQVFDIVYHPVRSLLFLMIILWVTTVANHGAASAKVEHGHVIVPMNVVQITGSI